MASVVQAFDLDNEFGQVALKLLPAATEDRWRRAAFEREQEALARLAHPNIVRLLEVGRDEGTDQRYLVFPWYPTRLQAVFASAERSVGTAGGRTTADRSLGRASSFIAKAWFIATSSPQMSCSTPTTSRC